MNPARFSFFEIKFIKRFIYLSCLSFFIFQNFDGNSQNLFRRHFIIAYDYSNEFINGERSDNRLEGAVQILFKPKPERVVNYNNGDPSVLNKERENGIKFFDENKDEISFFQFNISNNKIASLNTRIGSDKSTVLRNFNDSFFKNPNLNWSRFKKVYRPEIYECLNNNLNFPGNPSNYSLPNIVYPLIFNNIDKTTFAEEYILIILTEGSVSSYNTEDLNIIKDIFQVPRQTIISDNTPMGYINSNIEYLTKQYNKEDYFNYSFSVNNSSIGIHGYKITPKNVNPGTAGTAVTIDSDIKLSQIRYEGVEFKLSKIKVNYPLNEFLSPSEINLAIIKQNNNSKEDTIFKGIVETENYAESWSLKLMHKVGLMKNNSSFSYSIKNLNLNIAKINSDDDIDNLKYNFVFKTKYNPTDANSLNYIFYSEANSSNIDFVTSNEYATFKYVIPFGIIIILFIVLLIYFFISRPKNVLIKIDSVNDNYEEFNFADNIGRNKYELFQLTPATSPFTLQLRILVLPKTAFSFLWRKIPTYIVMKDVKLPNGFDIVVEDKWGNIYYPGNELKVYCNPGEDKLLKIILKSTVTPGRNNVKLISFAIKTTYNLSRIFRAEASLLKSFNYKVYEKLDDVWLGVDPGTTGSCIVSGHDSQSIYIEKEEERHDLITPSVISFDTEKEIPEDFDVENGFLVDNQYYDCGYEAIQTQGDQYIKFRSIKKLLGFRNKQDIVFKNRKKIHLNGKDLTSILVNHLIETHKISVERKNIQSSMNNNNEFTPQRAVFAIPNNFTATKISALNESIKKLNRFEEIRYIYEADAVLVSYLFNMQADKRMDNELVLIFDMGGATINVTLSRIRRKRLLNSGFSYEIDNLIRLGYGIGGDTIDYYLIKAIIDIAQDQSIKDPFDDNNFDVNLLTNLGLHIKETIIENFNDKSKIFLLNKFEIEDVLLQFQSPSKKFHIDESITDKFKVLPNRKIDSLTSFAFEDNFLENEYLKKNIFNAIHEIINEVLDLSKTKEINNVIFSGRSTAFPGIISTVKKSFKSKAYVPGFKTFDFDQVKSVVAKGACLYGLNRNSIKINNLNTSSSFGFKQTADIGIVKYVELVPLGVEFQNNGQLGYLHGQKILKSTFPNDSLFVNYYQIMGADPEKILKENQKHKFSLLSKIKVQKESELIGMKVWENDNIECFLKEINSNTIKKSEKLKDQDIYAENELHYTWMIK